MDAILKAKISCARTPPFPVNLKFLGKEVIDMPSSTDNFVPHCLCTCFSFPGCPLKMHHLKRPQELVCVVCGRKYGSATWHPWCKGKVELPQAPTSWRYNSNILLRILYLYLYLYAVTKSRWRHCVQLSAPLFRNRVVVLFFRTIRLWGREGGCRDCSKQIFVAHW